MSKESTQWLNANTLVGFRKQVEVWAGNMYAGGGAPWWEEDGFTGAYDGPIPIVDAIERLFAWDALGLDVSYSVPREVGDPRVNLTTDDGAFERITDKGRQVIVRSDTGQAFFYPTTGYAIEQHRDWLLHLPQQIVDSSDLGLASVGLLRGGGVAYACFQLEETMVAEGSFAFRPSLLLVNSHDGTRSKRALRTIHVPVCDNSMDAELLRANAHQIRRKHTSGRGGSVNIIEARDALGIVWAEAEAFKAEVARLIEWQVTDDQFAETLVSAFPAPDPIVDKEGKVTNQRAINSALDKQETVWGLWESDPRVCDWRGTGLGALQAHNTWVQQESNVRNVTRLERNMLDVTSGKTGDMDREFMQIVAGVTGVEMVGA